MSDPDLPPLDDQPIAVVGAGMAGLTAARRLAKAGATVTVFEKSRGVGGRLATRRTDHGAIDHGAQYVTAREPAFKAFAARAKAEGTLAVWTPRGKDGDDEWLVGLPRMNSVVAALVDGFEVATEKTVREIRDDGASLALVLDDGTEAAGFARVVVAIPGPQAAALLAPHGAPFDRLAGVRFGPCWTLIAALAEPLDPGFDVRREIGGLAWVAATASRPGREGHAWVAQASPDWSRQHLEDEPESVRAALTDLLAEALGTAVAPVESQIHRWRYALVESAVGETFLLSEDGRIGACGDHMIAPRVESAWTSGGGLAEAMIARAVASNA